MVNIKNLLMVESDVYKSTKLKEVNKIKRSDCLDYLYIDLYYEINNLINNISYSEKESYEYIFDKLENYIKSGINKEDVDNLRQILFDEKLSLLSRYNKMMKYIDLIK